MPNLTLDLSERTLEYLQKRVDDGDFDDVEEAAEEAISLMRDVDRDPEAKLAALRAAAKVGFDALDRGDYIQLDTKESFDAFFERLRGAGKIEKPEEERLSA